ncbi:ATP-binding protein [Massilia jejuensis]|uniref:ATP-binding protein n=1 Tax=Massilia jejuensis TaxID=648894 RepID=A0ABW0PM23_9BURK
MTLKPWREIAVPHEDVLKGTFQQAEFAADISKVHQGIAPEEYQDASLFFQRTFITEGMRLLLDSVVKRLAGKGGDPVVQLQTAFGGGKTHTLLAVYHLAKGATPASKMLGISPILDAADITELPKARVAVLDGVDLLDLASKPRAHGNTTVKTIWGELAWQLGGEAAYAKIMESDRDGTAPGKTVLAEIIRGSAPCIILMDELVRYVSQFEEGKTLSGGTYDTQLSFVQALTEALKAVPNAILLASLPFSDREAGSQQGVKALRALEHYFGRVQALWKPVATEEAFEIVRRRLFAKVNDELAAEEVCRAYADYYTANAGDLPQDVQGSGYLERLKHAYPIHPEVFDRLYEDWSSLDNFQRTRGVLKMMATVIHRLWTTGNNDLLIQPGSLPLFDSATRNEAIYYLPQGWDPVLERDIDGERAATTELDNARPLFGAIHACRRIARTVFLGSAPDAGAVGGAKHHRGIELERVLLGCAQPGQVLGHYKDGARALVDRLQYLNSANNRFWFDTRPNLRREMEERKRRFNLREDVYPFIKDKLRFSNGVFGGVHVFTPSADVPDDWQLRLVVLPPEATFSKGAQSAAIDAATAILKNRGDQPRQKQNRLVFLAPDTDSLARLKDQVTSSLAWRSIVEDVREGRLNLDGHQTKQASNSLDLANDALGRMIRETFKWLLAPLQEAKPGKGIGELQWDHFQINPAVINRVEEIERVLKENELLINEWAPIHLAKMLQTWFWKDDTPTAGALDVWQKTCCYLYLPRLRDSDTIRSTIAAGLLSRDFFGIAYGVEEGRYQGFHFAENTTPIFDDSLLLIDPNASSTFAARLAEEAAEREAKVKGEAAGAASVAGEPTPSGGATSKAEGASVSSSTTSAAGSGPRGSSASAKKRMFFGSVELNPNQAKLQFSDVAEEVLMLLNKPGVKLRIAVEIEAELPSGFDESVQRAVRENCDQLKFKNRSFEE